MRNTTWVLERMAAARPGSGGDASTDVQPLVDTLLALRRGRDLHVFGVVPAAVEAEGKPQVIAAAEAALRDWRTAFSRDGNRYGLWELHRAAALIDMPDLRLEKPFALLCDPLGDRARLAPKWQNRLAHLESAVAGRSQLALAGVGYDARPRMIKLGPPNMDWLYGQALRYETNTGKMFPIELAAWWSIADGVSIDAAWFLAPAKNWTLHGKIEGAVVIGGGRYTRGSMTLAPDGSLIDANEAGAVFRTYPDFATLADLLLAI